MGVLKCGEYWLSNVLRAILSETPELSKTALDLENLPLITGVKTLSTMSIYSPPNSDTRYDF